MKSLEIKISKFLKKEELEYFEKINKNGSKYESVSKLILSKYFDREFINIGNKKFNYSPLFLKEMVMFKKYKYVNNNLFPINNIRKKSNSKTDLLDNQNIKVSIKNICSELTTAGIIETLTIFQIIIKYFYELIDKRDIELINKFINKILKYNYFFTNIYIKGIQKREINKIFKILENHKDIFEKKILIKEYLKNKEIKNIDNLTNSILFLYKNEKILKEIKNDFILLFKNLSKKFLEIYYLEHLTSIFKFNLNEDNINEFKIFYKNNNIHEYLSNKDISISIPNYVGIVDIHKDLLKLYVIEKDYIKKFYKCYNNLSFKSSSGITFIVNRIQC